MRYLILDLETLPHPNAGEWLEPVGCDPALLEPILPNTRLKTPALVEANLEEVARKIAARPAEIEASIKERTAARDAELGLDPDCNMIAAVGYFVVGNKEPFCDVTFGEEKIEGDALEHLWWEFNKNPHDTRFVSFYGRSFDLPVLMRRSMYLGIKHPELNLDRWKSPHIDVWDKLTYGGALRKARSLAFYGKRMGFSTLDKVDGKDVAKLAKSGDWEAIKQHCLSDVGLTHALANRLGLLKIGAVAA
jgi:uncharacterized protein YprB with RNaseH-like and TPR domain